jgi:glyoxylase-like metal-dependent hydrolase (beta-lactamase superfamily II)
MLRRPDQTPADRPRAWRQPVGGNPARLAPRPHGVYRFRIGRIEAAIVSDGPLTLPAAQEIFRDTPPDDLARTLHAAFLPTDRVVVEQNCVLLDLGGHLVLIDNGMGSARQFGLESGRLLENLREAGVAPEQIDSLVLTHAHPDHCWGTMRDDGQPNFPNARIHLAAAEWAYWTGPRGEDDGLSAAGFRKHLSPLRARVLPFADGEEILPGLHALATPGHTPGHSSFMIASDDAQACVLGDVAFHPVLSFAWPGAPSAYDADPVAGQATRLGLLEGLAAERMRVLHYHGPWPGIGHVAREGAAFRWCAEAPRFDAPAASAERLPSESGGRAELAADP